MAVRYTLRKNSGTSQSGKITFDDRLAQRLQNRWQLRFWMLKHLPMGLLSGMYIESLGEEGCKVVLKDRWWIRNPFRSVFWAVMSMAAEMSTGALMYAYVSGSKLQFILVQMEAKFFRKAKGKSSYFCYSGQDVLRWMQNIEDTGDTSVVILPVVARDEDNQILAEFKFYWQLRKPIK
jgi:hypothetical protein